MDTDKSDLALETMQLLQVSRGLLPTKRFSLPQFILIKRALITSMHVFMVYLFFCTGNVSLHAVELTFDGHNDSILLPHCT